MISVGCGLLACGPIRPLCAPLLLRNTPRDLVVFPFKRLLESPMKKVMLLVSATLCLAACSDENMVNPLNTPGSIGQSGCHEDYRRCKDNDLQSCKSGEWITVDVCPYGCDVQKIACQSEPTGETPQPPTTKCETGDKKCSDSVLMTCSVISDICHS